MNNIAGKIKFNEIPKAFMVVMETMNKAIEESKLEISLVELIRLKSSFLNKCEFCTTMHVDLAKELGLSIEKIDAVKNHRESKVLSDFEKKILTLTEKLTLSSTQEIDFPLQEEIISETSKENFAYIVLAIVHINSWNRIARSFGL